MTNEDGPFEIHRSDIDRCPMKSLSAAHYNRDGTCACDDEVLAKVEYTPSQLPKPASLAIAGEQMRLL